MIRMAVFDMAGTTVDENNVVYKTLQKAINEKGFNFSLDQVLAEGAGKEKLNAIKSVLKVYGGNDDAKTAEGIYQRFVVLLAEAYSKQDVLPQPNALELFRALKQRNILVMLNTGYNRDTAHTLIDKLDWKKATDYDGLITASDVAKGRPHPDMILLAMKQYNLADASEVMKVGDSIIDIEEGRSAGCGIVVGITTGAHTAAQLESAKPDYIIHNLREILPLLQ